MRERKVSRLKVGDEVMVIAGKSRGLQGKIKLCQFKTRSAFEDLRPFICSACSRFLFVLLDMESIDC